MTYFLPTLEHTILEILLLIPVGTVVAQAFIIAGLIAIRIVAVLFGIACPPLGAVMLFLREDDPAKRGPGLFDDIPGLLKGTAIIGAVLTAVAALVVIFLLWVSLAINTPYKGNMGVPGKIAHRIEVTARNPFLKSLWVANAIDCDEDARAKVLALRCKERDEGLTKGERKELEVLLDKIRDFEENHMDRYQEHLKLRLGSYVDPVDIDRPRELPPPTGIVGKYLGYPYSTKPPYDRKFLPANRKKYQPKEGKRKSGAKVRKTGI